MAYTQPHTSSAVLDRMLAPPKAASPYAGNRMDSLAWTPAERAHKRSETANRNAASKHDEDAFAAHLQELCRQEEKEPLQIESLDKEPQENEAQENEPLNKSHEPQNNTHNEPACDDAPETDSLCPTDHSLDGSAKFLQISEWATNKQQATTENTTDPSGEPSAEPGAELAAPGQESLLHMAGTQAEHAQQTAPGTIAASTNPETQGSTTNQTEHKQTQPDALEETEETSLAEALLQAQQLAKGAKTETGKTSVTESATPPLANTTSQPATSALIEQPESPVDTATPMATTTLAPATPAHPPMDAQMLREKFDMLVMSAMKATHHEIRIQLEPLALGRLTLECRETQQGMDLSINTQSTAIRNLLAEQEQALRQALESQGLQLGQFSVACQDRQQQQQHASGQPTATSNDEQETEAESNPQNKNHPTLSGFARSGHHWIA